MRVDLGHNLTVERAEQLIRSAAVWDGDGVFRLNLEGLRKVQLGAGWRVASALKQLALAGDVDVQLPPSVLANNSDGFRLLARSGLGPALAQWASRVEVEGLDELSRLTASYPAESESVHQNWVDIRGLRPIERLVADRFESQIARWLRRLNVAERLNKVHLRHLLSLLREALENVVDHSAKSPNPPGDTVSAAFTGRWYRSEQGAHAGPLGAFIDGTEPVVGRQQLVGFLELTVFDDGAGVAARFAQDRRVYGGPIDFELETTLSALEPGSSSKPRTLDAEIRGDPGYGFSWIAEAVRSLDGFAMVRTGRVAMWTGPTAESAYVPVEQLMGFVLGTCIQAVIPVRTAQLTLLDASS